jgi:hypothetical protein
MVTRRTLTSESSASPVTRHWLQMQPPLLVCSPLQARPRSLLERLPIVQPIYLGSTSDSRRSYDAVILSKESAPLEFLEALNIFCTFIYISLSIRTVFLGYKHSYTMYPYLWFSQEHQFQVLKNFKHLVRKNETRIVETRMNTRKAASEGTPRAVAQHRAILKIFLVDKARGSPTTTHRHKHGTVSTMIQENNVIN